MSHQLHHEHGVGAQGRGQDQAEQAEHGQCAPHQQQHHHQQVVDAPVEQVRGDHPAQGGDQHIQGEWAVHGGGAAGLLGVAVGVADLVADGAEAILERADEHAVFAEDDADGRGHGGGKGTDDGDQTAIEGEFAAGLRADSDNLVMKAIALLRARYGADRVPPLAIKLTKRLPVAAGIGGGSARKSSGRCR